jgi:hypothetical protein
MTNRRRYYARVVDLEGHMTDWQRWIWHPQSEWLRKATFQIHMWSGIGVGLYVLMISVTGSILVYRNELYVRVLFDQ